MWKVHSNYCFCNLLWVLNYLQINIKNFDCVDYKIMQKFFKKWEYQTTLPVCWETCMQVMKQQLEMDMEQWTGSTLGKEYAKAVSCHPA